MKIKKSSIIVSNPLFFELFEILNCMQVKCQPRNAIIYGNIKKTYLLFENNLYSQGLSLRSITSLFPNKEALKEKELYVFLLLYKMSKIVPLDKKFSQERLFFQFENKFVEEDPKTGGKSKD